MKVKLNYDYWPEPTQVKNLEPGDWFRIPGERGVYMFVTVSTTPMPDKAFAVYVSGHDTGAFKVAQISNEMTAVRINRPTYIKVTL